MLPTFVGNPTLLGESFVPCLHSQHAAESHSRTHLGRISLNFPAQLNQVDFQETTGVFLRLFRQDHHTAQSLSIRVKRISPSLTFL